MLCIWVLDSLLANLCIAPTACYHEHGCFIIDFTRHFYCLPLSCTYTKYIMCFQTTVSQSTLFDHLINIWEFSPGPVPGTCNLHFLVDFKFQSPLYRQVISFQSESVFPNFLFGPSFYLFEKSVFFPQFYCLVLNHACD